MFRTEIRFLILKISRFQVWRTEFSLPEELDGSSNFFLQIIWTFWLYLDVIHLHTRFNETLQA